MAIIMPETAGKKKIWDSKRLYIDIESA